MAYLTLTKKTPVTWPTFVTPVSATTTSVINNTVIKQEFTVTELVRLVGIGWNRISTQPASVAVHGPDGLLVGPLELSLQGNSPVTFAGLNQSLNPDETYSVSIAIVGSAGADTIDGDLTVAYDVGDSVSSSLSMRYSVAAATTATVFSSERVVGAIAPLNRFDNSYVDDASDPSDVTFANPDTLQRGDFILQFQSDRLLTSIIPPEPNIQKSDGQFIISLPQEWMPDDLKEWDIQYQKGPDNAQWGDWIDLGTYAAAKYEDTIIDPDNIESISGAVSHVVSVSPENLVYYRHRYKLRTLTQTSDWSEPSISGLPDGSEDGTGTDGDDGGDGGDAIVGLESRRIITFTTDLIDPTASGNADVVLYPQERVIRASVSAACNLRAYSSTDHRTADVTRDPRQDPDRITNHGLLLELGFGEALLQLDLAPPAIVYNNDPTQMGFFAVKNMSSVAQQFTVTITVQREEK